MNLESSKILFVIHSLNGGAGKMIKHVTNLLSNYATVSLMTFNTVDRPIDLNDNIAYYCLNYLRRGLLGRLCLMSKIRKKIKEIHPDIVCVFVSDNCVNTRLATLGLNIKYCSAERGDPYSEPFMWDKLVRWSYYHSDYCFFQLEGARDYYGNRLQEKSFVIPNAFKADDNVVLFEGKRKKTIVSAGRFVSEKRFEVLIEAFSRVYKQHPDYSLLLYGQGPYLDKYKELVSHFKLDGHVFFPGYVPNVAEAIREDGVFVLSSRLEGMPNVLIEALSTGIPCVTTDCNPGGPAFLTKNGRNGALVKIDDVDEMACSIMRVIEDSQYAHELSVKGPEIINELQPEIINSKWVEAFKKICAE